MKQKNFNNSGNFKKCLIFPVTFLFLFAHNLGAQSISWETTPASPSLSAPAIGILSEDALLDLRFTYTVPTQQIAAENNKSKSIQIELPAGVSIEGAAKGTQGSSGSNIATGAVTNSGTTYQIPVISITYNQMVH
jgi:hypothetical protein